MRANIDIGGVILEGWLWKKMKHTETSIQRMFVKQYKKRWVVLNDTMMFYYKDPDKQKELGSIDIESVSVFRDYRIESPESMKQQVLYAMDLTTTAEDRTFTLCAETEEALLAWKYQIVRMVDSNHRMNTVIVSDDQKVPKNSYGQRRESAFFKKGAAPKKVRRVCMLSAIPPLTTNTPTPGRGGQPRGAPAGVPRKPRDRPARRRRARLRRDVARARLRAVRSNRARRTRCGRGLSRCLGGGGRVRQRWWGQQRQRRGRGRSRGRWPWPWPWRRRRRRWGRSQAQKPPRGSQPADCGEPTGRCQEGPARDEIR